MAALLAVYLANLVGSRWLAKARPDQLFWGLLALPVMLSFIVGADQRFIGLFMGLSLIRLSGLVGRRWPSLSGLNSISLVLAGTIPFQLGCRIEYLTNPWGGVFALHALSFPLTLLWIVLVSGALRMLAFVDRSGRLLAPVLLVTLGALLIVELLQSYQVGLIPIAAGLALLGFVLGSWQCSERLSRLSEELGFSLALLSISGLLKGSTSLALLVPLLSLSLPMLSTRLAFVTLTVRCLPTLGLFSHWLIRRGHSPRAATLLVFLSASALVIVSAAVAHSVHPYALSAGLLLALSTGLLATWPTAQLGSVLRQNARRIELFGVPIDRVNLNEATAYLLNWASVRSGSHLIVTPDTTALMRARWDRDLQAIYQQAALVTADGTGIVWAARLFGARLPERVTGIDLIEAIGQQATEFYVSEKREPCRLFLLGAKPGVAAEAARRLQMRYRGLTIVGTHHGYFSREEEGVLEEVRRATPDILLVGLGMPRQELWMMAHKDRLGVPVLMGVGGSFDVISGRVRRAPHCWQRLGFEWVYRAIREPRRFLKLSSIPLFVGRVLTYKALQLIS